MWLRGDREFPFDCLEIFHSGEGVKYQVFQHLKRNFVRPSDHVIFFLVHKIVAVQQKMLYAFYFKNYVLNLTT